MAQANKIKNIVIRAISIICIIVVVFSLIFIILGVVARKQNRMMGLFGYSYSIVASGSMEPTIKTGSIIIAKAKDYSKINEEDIVIYYSQTHHRYIVHRVEEDLHDGTFTMKGDNNSSIDDERLNEDNYISHVTSYGLAFIGLVILNSQNLIFLIIVMLFTIYLTLELTDLKRLMKEAKKEKAQARQLEIARLTMREELIKEIEEELKIQKKDPSIFNERR